MCVPYICLSPSLHTRHGYPHRLTVAMGSRIQTRKSNQDAHPGMPDYDSDTAALAIPTARKARRTPAQMKADRDAIEAAKEVKEQERKQNIKKVATIENGLAAADEENRKSAARPAQNATLKIARPQSKVVAALTSDKQSNNGTCLSILSSNSDSRIRLFSPKDQTGSCATRTVRH